MIRHKLVLAACAATVLATGGCAHSVPVETNASPEDLDLLKSNLERAATAQEIHYSYPPNNHTYAAEPERLMRYRPDPGIKLTIFGGTRNGWSGMVQLGSGAACVIYVGEVAEIPETPRGTIASGPKVITCDKARSS